MEFRAHSSCTVDYDVVIFWFITGQTGAGTDGVEVLGRGLGLRLALQYGRSVARSRGDEG